MQNADTPQRDSCVYLDNAATSFPKPESVYRALDAFARQSVANPGRAGHKMALAAERALDDCRHLLNQLFHGKEPQRWIFTFNGTDALNMAFKGVLKDRDHVITTDLEHNSISRPLRALELAGRIGVTRLPADVVGTIQPITEIGSIARETDLLFLVDAAQTAGVIPIDIQAMCIDLLAFPGHKSLLGPTGTGALYVGPAAIVGAWREGGTGGDSSSETQPREYPYFLEGGTPNVLGVAGLATGIKYVTERGIDRIHTHETALTERLWQKLNEIGGFQVFGHRDMSKRVGTLSIHTDAVAAPELGGILDQAFDIAVRPGLHCAPYIHRSLGTFPDGTVRVSPGAFNTVADIDLLARALAEIVV